MDSHSRVFTTFALGEPDRVPVMQMALYHGVRLLGKELGSIRDVDVAIAAMGALYERYQPDILTPSFGCKYWLYGDLGIELRLPSDGFDSVVEPYWRTEEDVDNKPLPDPRDPGNLIHNQIRLLEGVANQYGDRVVLASFGGSSLGRTGDLVGTERILELLIEDPGLAHKMVSKVAGWVLELARASIDAGAQIIGLVDPTAGGSVISRKHFVEFSLPVLQWINAEIKKHRDIPTYLHICGDVGDRLDLMADTGVDGISVDHLVDVAAAKREVGDRVCIIGNINPVGTLLLGTPEKVLEESRRCIAEAGQGGGFVLAPGCGVPPNSPPENMEAMRDAAERYGGYPLVGTRAGRGDI